MEKKQRALEIVVKIVVAALTARARAIAQALSILPYPNN